MNPFAAIARKIGLQQQLGLLVACGLLGAALFGAWVSGAARDTMDTVLWSCGFAVLVFLLIRAVTLRLTASLRTLALLMVRAGHGDASVRADERDGPRDVVAMARTFNRIMDSTVKLDEQVQQSALRLRQMVEHWPAGAIYIEDGATLLNNASERITGYGRDEIITIDQWFANIHGDDPAAARALYEQDRAAGFPAPRELAIRRRDGRHCLVEFAGYVQSHSEVWLIHDITERKQIEQELKQTLAEQKAILENSVIGIAIIKHRTIVRANTGMELLLGYAAGEMTGLSTRHWYCSDSDFEAVGAAILSVTQRGDIFSQDIELMRKDGSKVWCSLHAKAKDADVADASGVCVLQDITARKQAEQMLNEMNRTLELAVADLRQAQGQLIHSEKMAALGQLVAGVAHEINTPIGAVKSSGKNIADSLDQALDHMPTLFRLLEPDAISLFMRLIGHRGEKTTMLSTREERVIARELETRLEQAAIEHARQRASILVQLHAYDSYADYLPLLRHPECELILNTAYSIVTIATNTANINVAVERVTKIIFALKSFSRIDLDGEMVEADLREGIETVLTIYQNQIKQHTELVRHYEDIAPLRCLPDELNQVWTNLIHNALHAMANRGTLTIRVGREGNEAVVAIGDSGCGIEPAIRERIFDAFFTTKAAGEGSGLGLDIVRKIIEKHGGRIALDSTVGVGSTFRVYLPYQVEEV